MKTVEQLEKLSQNPFYTMTEAEAKILEQSRKEQGEISVTTEDDKKKEYRSRGNATVKETGKLDKHHGDPVKE